MLGPSVAKGFETLSENHGFSKWEQPHFIQCFIIVFTCFHHKKFHVLGVHKVNNGKYTTFFWAKPVDFFGNSHGVGAEAVAQNLLL